MQNKLKNFALATLAVGALALSACGGADDPVDAGTDAPTTVAAQPATDEPTQAEPTDAATTEAPVEEAPEATPEDTPETTEDAPDGSAGGAEDELVRNMAEGMKGVETIKTTTEGSTGTSVVYTDLRDPANLVSYQVTEAGGTKMEVVADSEKSATRVGDGEWMIQPHSPETKKMIEDAAAQFDPDKMRQVYQSVELVDAAERQYKVSLTGFGSESIDMNMWLDEHHRPIKQEFTIGDIAQTSTIEYNVPVDIPTVG